MEMGRFAEHSTHTHKHTSTRLEIHKFMRAGFELENAWDSQRCINVSECILNEAKTTMSEA